MSRFGSNPDEFLPLLKQYLAADAGEDYHDLEEVPRKLTEFAPSGPYACREAVELLGTAVGNSSNSSYAEILTKQPALMVFRELAKTIRADWYPRICSPTT